MVSGWEESAELKLYIHPGASVREAQAGWTSVDVRGGQNLTGVEDAAFADMNVDGNPDAIVSATEGEGARGNRRIRIHRWDSSKPVSDPDSWQGSVVFRDEPGERFMKVRTAQLDGKNGADIVAASRDLFENEQNPGEVTTKGGIFLYTSPPLARISDTTAWNRQRLADVHKGKSIELLDMDSDQDTDILYSGAKNVLWLENPGDAGAGHEWKSHWIGIGSDLTLCDVDGDGVQDIVATASRKEYPVVARWFQGVKEMNNRNRSWQPRDIRIEPELPIRFYQSGQFSLKSIACGHFRQQATSSDPPDIVITASGSGFGIFMVVAPPGYEVDSDVPWAAVPVTDYSWIMKYDNILSIDMDSDGDMDLVTTEENEGLLLQGAGVLWYENKSCQ